MAEHKITLAHKKNVKDNEANKTALLQRMKTLTGSDWEFVLSPALEEFVPGILKVSNNRVNTIGDYLFGKESYLYWIVEKFAEACKDDMIKEALLDATKGRKIVFTLKPDESKDPKIQFTDGNFHVYTTPTNFGYNVKYIAEGNLASEPPLDGSHRSQRTSK